MSLRETLGHLLGRTSGTGLPSTVDGRTLGQPATILSGGLAARQRAGGTIRR